MHGIQFHSLKIFFKILAISLCLFFIASTFVGCSKADATTKNEKSKRSKVKLEEEEETEDEEAETAEKDSESEKKSAEENKSSENAKIAEKKSDKNTEAKAGEESDQKAEEKSSKKNAKLKKDAKNEASEIWLDLVKGNKRFVSGKHTTINYTTSRTNLVKGQKPQAIVLGCADSRVPPEFVFDKNLGELFVVRDAGNIADEVSLGSIEYAVEHLHAKVLVVLGHESCGAVAATVSGEKMPTRNLRAIIESIAPAFENSKDCVIGGKINLSCIELNVKHSSEDVVSKSSILKEAIAKGELTVIRAVYKMETGEVVRLD